MQIPHDVIADTVWPVFDRFGDFNTLPSVKFVQLIGVADQEIHDAALRIRCALSQKHLHLAEVHARKSWRIAPREASREP
jgi:hypothetical protein